MPIHTIYCTQSLREVLTDFQAFIYVIKVLEATTMQHRCTFVQDTVVCISKNILFIYLLISKNPSGYNANVQNYNVAK